MQSFAHLTPKAATCYGGLPSSFTHSNIGGGRRRRQRHRHCFDATDESELLHKAVSSCHGNQNGWTYSVEVCICHRSGRLAFPPRLRRSSSSSTSPARRHAKQLTLPPPVAADSSSTSASSPSAASTTTSAAATAATTQDSNNYCLMLPEFPTESSCSPTASSDSADFASPSAACRPRQWRPRGGSFAKVRRWHAESPHGRSTWKPPPPPHRMHPTPQNWDLVGPSSASDDKEYGYDLSSVAGYRQRRLQGFASAPVEPPLSHSREARSLAARWRALELQQLQLLQHKQHLQQRSQQERHSAPCWARSHRHTAAYC